MWGSHNDGCFLNKCGEMGKNNTLYHHITPRVWVLHWASSLIFKELSKNYSDPKSTLEKVGPRLTGKFCICLLFLLRNKVSLWSDPPLTVTHYEYASKIYLCLLHFLSSGQMDSNTISPQVLGTVALHWVAMDPYILDKGSLRNFEVLLPNIAKPV